MLKLSKGDKVLVKPAMFPGRAFPGVVTRRNKLTHSVAYHAFNVDWNGTFHDSELELVK